MACKCGSAVVEYKNGKWYCENCGLKAKWKKERTKCSTKQKQAARDGVDTLTIALILFTVLVAFIGGLLIGTTFEQQGTWFFLFGGTEAGGECYWASHRIAGKIGLDVHDLRVKDCPEIFWLENKIVHEEVRRSLAEIEAEK